MQNESTEAAQITVTESARGELSKLMKDTAGQKPRIYLAGFG